MSLLENDGETASVNDGGSLQFTFSFKDSTKSSNFQCVCLVC